MTARELDPWADLIGLKRQVRDAIVKAMQKRGVNRTSLATLLGVSRPYVSAMLSGDENFSLAQVDRVLGALRFRLEFRLVQVRRR